MRDYELVYIVRPSVGEADLSALNDRVKSWIDADGGEVHKMSPWGRRRLAYKVDDFRDALYVQLNFRAQPNTLTTIERNLKLTEDVIRYLLIRQGE